MLPLGAWPGAFNPCGVVAAVRVGLSRSSDLLRMLSMEKELGVVLVVGEGLGLPGWLLDSWLSLWGGGEALHGCGNEGICACNGREFGWYRVNWGQKVSWDSGTDCGRPTGGKGGRFMQVE